MKDALVVLGAALRPDGGLGAALAERVEAGVAAWKAGRAPRLLMTGAVEARAMKRRAVELGVPDDAVLVETRALTTRENALFSAQILGSRARVLIVTQAYHRPRAVAAFRRAGLLAEALEFASRSPPPRAHFRELAARVIYKLRRWS
jgi:uncharacterized SAM-binding protein YcdF (DUF218 family)